MRAYAGGVSGGGLLILIVELSLGLGRLRGSRRRRTESSLVAARTGAALATGLLGLLLCASGFRSAGDRAWWRRADAGFVSV